MKSNESRLSRESSQLTSSLTSKIAHKVTARIVAQNQLKTSRDRVKCIWCRTAEECKSLIQLMILNYLGLLSCQARRSFRICHIQHNIAQVLSKITFRHQIRIGSSSETSISKRDEGLTHYFKIWILQQVCKWETSITQIHLYSLSHF